MNAVVAPENDSVAATAVLISSKFPNAYREFLSWVTHSWSSFSLVERSLADLILANFDEVASVGVARSKRGQTIAKLIVECPVNKAHPVEPPGDVALKRASLLDYELKELRVGPFRGFAQPETFKFDRRFTVVYGPNGSGKSSFSEALEYSMLGNIQEAQSKRIDLSLYVKNVVVKEFSAPRLVVRKKNGDDETVLTAHSDSARFCFIERNRIEGFSRISASTAGDQEGRIAALFGLDEFKEFVNGFNDSIDACIDLVGRKALELKTKKEKLADQNARRTQQIVILRDLARERRGVSTNANWKNGFRSLKIFLTGSGNGVGEIKRLDQLLEKPFSASIQLPAIEKIAEYSGQVDAIFNDFAEAAATIERYKEQLDYSQLYQSLVKLRSLDLSSCPACLTPLTHVQVDPFKHADQQIEQLRQLIEAKTSMATSGKQLTKLLNDISREVTSWNRAVSTLKHPEFTYSPPADSLEQAELSVVRTAVGDAQAALSFFHHSSLALADAATRHNEEIKQIKSERAKLSEQRDRLRDVLIQIQVIETRLNDARKAIKLAEQEIDAFEISQKELIEAELAERPVINRNREFQAAYDSLLAKLRAHMERLPSTFASELSERATYFYNAINKHDNEFDKLSNLKLPSAAGQGIRVSFVGTEKEEHNALHVLSEGHIRCLGLSILLAKNVKEECPIIVFDDVVNAIDDEHRHAIVEVLCFDPLLSNKQMIITSHGEEFIKTFELEFGKQNFETYVRRYDFYGEKDSRKIVVKNGNPRHYLTRAENFYASQEWRSCLAECRRALENLANTVWKRMGNRYKTQLQVSMTGPNRAPDLASLVDALCKTLPNRCVGDPKFTDICSKLTEVQRHSEYLNKGTHEEDRDQEFDRIRVRSLLDSLITLEAAVKGE